MLLAPSRPSFGVLYDKWLSMVLGVNCWSVRPRPDGERELESLGDSEFVSARCEVADTQTLDALVGHGLRIVDTALLLSVDPKLINSTPSSGLSCADVTVGLAQVPESETVAQMASRSLTLSRFHLDHQFPAELASKIKYEWGKALALGLRGDGCMVARQGGQIRGFLGVATPTSSPGLSVVDLIAVDPEFRNHGIGRLLLGALLRDAAASGHQVQVGTQAANTGAVRFYEGLGFRLRSAQYVLHSNWPLRGTG